MRVKLNSRWLISAFLVFCIIILSSCSSTFQPVRLSPTTNRFPTNTVLQPKSYVVKEEIDTNRFRSLLYIKTEAETKYHTFIYQMCKNMEFFDAVKDKNEMSSLVIEHGLSDSIQNISEMMGLHQLQKEIGDFFVADYVLEFLGGFRYKFLMKITNPQDAKVLLHVENEVINWAGLDKTLFYPVFNAIKDWLEANAE